MVCKVYFLTPRRHKIFLAPLSTRYFVIFLSLSQRTLFCFLADNAADFCNRAILTYGSVEGLYPKLGVCFGEKKLRLTFHRESPAATLLELGSPYPTVGNLWFRRRVIS